MGEGHARIYSQARRRALLPDLAGFCRGRIEVWEKADAAGRAALAKEEPEIEHPQGRGSRQMAWCDRETFPSSNRFSCFASNRALRPEGPPRIRPSRSIIWARSAVSDLRERNRPARLRRLQQRRHFPAARDERPYREGAAPFRLQEVEGQEPKQTVRSRRARIHSSARFVLLRS